MAPYQNRTIPYRQCMLTSAQERRRVEEQYVQGLRKLANRHPPDESSELGYAQQKERAQPARID